MASTFHRGENPFNALIPEPDWTVTELQVSKDGKNPRNITHFQFTAWPDHGVPDGHHTLLNFVKKYQKFSEIKNMGQKPVVVHCSAGVGRTGTFIALDWALQVIVDGKKVNFFLDSN